MRAKIIIAILAGIIIGFAIGFAKSILYIVSHQYIHYKMFRLIGFTLQDYLHTWIIKSIFITLSGTLIALFLFRVVKWQYIEKICEGIFSFINTKVRLTALILIICLFILNICVIIDNRINVVKGPNVILIGIDTLRADHVGCYRYNKSTTPAIDEIAKQSVVFERAFSTTSWTLPSFHSILTSLYQISHGVITGDYKLNDSFITFAELLKDRGYRTAGFISGPYLKNIFGFNQGFDLYNESASNVTKIGSHGDITSPQLTELVLPWVRKNRNHNFFLFIHYWDPHYDYIPPAPYNEMFDPDYKGNIDGTNIYESNKINPKMNRRDLEHIIALYDGEIRWTDMHIGILVDSLKKWDLYNNSIIIITGDHGEEFLEHGRHGHRKTLYNEVIHVPLILKIPGITKYKNFRTVVSTVDILPTVLDILNIEHPGSVDGESLMPIIYGKEDRKQRPVYSELDYDLSTIITQRWKLIHNSVSTKTGLIDMENDPSEKINLINVNVEEGRELKEKLSEWRRIKSAKNVAAPKAQWDNETIEKLKSLGYIQ